MISRELQIEMDDVYACLGACPGCVLSRNERRVAHPDMPEQIMDLALSRVRDYILNNSSDLDIDNLNLTFGIGDHLILGHQYVVDIYKKAARLIYDSNLGGDVFVTMSLIGKTKLVSEELRSLHKKTQLLGYKVKIIPVVVFDPIKMKTGRFWDGYFENIRLANNLFGRVDLTINLSTPTMEVMSGVELAEFSDRYNFHDVTINWNPTDGNIKDTANDMDFLTRWLIEFDIKATGLGIEFSYQPVFIRLNGLVDNEVSLIDAAKGIMFNTITRSLQFDHLGNFFGKLEGIGDMAMGPRFGIHPLGNVESNDIMNAIKGKSDFFAAQAVKDLFRQPVCQSCSLAFKCISSAAPVYNRVLYAAGIKSIDVCPTPMLDLYHHYGI